MLNIISKVSVENWFDRYRHGQSGLADEIARRVSELHYNIRNHDIPYIDKIWGRDSKTHNRKTTPGTLFFNEGYYLLDETVVLLPGLSVRGAGHNTVFRFEPLSLGYANRRWSEKDAHFARVKTASWLPFNGRAACFLCLGQNVLEAKDSTSWLYPSIGRLLTDFTVETRGDAVGFAFYGRQHDLRVHRLHLHGYGSDKSDTSTYGLVLVNEAVNPTDVVGVRSEVVSHFRTEYQDIFQRSHPLLAPVDGWGTNVFITESFFEGFTGAALFLVGSPMMVAHCQFWDCDIGIQWVSDASVLDVGICNFTKVRKPTLKGL